MQGTHGAALHAELDITHAQLVIRKGHHREIDSGLTDLYVCGLATDFCDLQRSCATAWQQMTRAGVRKMASEQVFA